MHRTRRDGGGRNGGGKAVVVALKGHPCTLKSTLARELARRLGAPLLSKDDVKGELSGEEDANEVAQRVLWQIVKTQVSLGLSCVVDATLSSPNQFARAREVTECDPDAQLVVVECITSDHLAWRERLEARAGRTPIGSRDSHKPQSWEELRALIDSYSGSFQYDPLSSRADYHFRLDTSAGLGCSTVSAALNEIVQKRKRGLAAAR